MRKNTYKIPSGPAKVGDAVIDVYGSLWVRRENGEWKNGDRSISWGYLVYRHGPLVDADMDNLLPSTEGSIIIIRAGSRLEWADTSEDRIAVLTDSRSEYPWKVFTGERPGDAFYERAAVVALTNYFVRYEAK